MAIRQTFTRRETALPREKPTGLSEAYVETWGGQWRTFLARERMAAAPNQLAAVVADLERFLLPLTKEADGDWLWKPSAGGRTERRVCEVFVLAGFSERRGRRCLASFDRR